MKAFVGCSFAARARALRPSRAGADDLVGLWGGQGIGIDIEGGVGAVQYDCAAGTIDQALPPQRPASASRERTGPEQVGQVRVGQIFTAQQRDLFGCRSVKDQDDL